MCLLPCGKARPVNEFLLYRRKETLRGGIVPAVSLPAHAAHDPCRTQLLLVIVAGVLTAPVTVAQQPGRRFSLCLCRRQCRHDERAVNRFACCPADNAAGEQIEDHRQIQPALSSRYGGNVCTPLRVRCLTAKFPVENVVRHRKSVFAVGGCYPWLGKRCLQPGKAHQVSHPFPADPLACLLQVVPNTRTAVSLAACPKQRANPLGQPRVLCVSGTGCSLAPCTRATRRNLHRATQSQQGKGTALFCDKGIPHRWSLLKMPTAFFRRAFSSRRRAFSRSRRASSGRYDSVCLASPHLGGSKTHCGFS